jgi:hypothetical protein
VDRGDWSFDRLSTAFEYIVGNTKTDRCVARVLSGWPRPGRGGLPPDLNDIANETVREKFFHLADYLFPNTLHLEVRRTLLAIQIRYYNEVCKKHPKSISIQIMNRKMQHIGLSPDDLQEAREKILAVFVAKNLADLGMDDVPESLAGGLDNVTEKLQLLQIGIESFDRKLTNSLEGIMMEKIQEMQSQINHISQQVGEQKQYITNEFARLHALFLTPNTLVHSSQPVPSTSHPIQSQSNSASIGAIPQYIPDLSDPNPLETDPRTSSIASVTLGTSSKQHVLNSLF